jgi:hypothetical protein
MKVVEKNDRSKTGQNASRFIVSLSRLSHNATSVHELGKMVSTRRRTSRIIRSGLLRDGSGNLYWSRHRKRTREMSRRERFGSPNLTLPHDGLNYAIEAFPDSEKTRSLAAFRSFNPLRMNLFLWQALNDLSFQVGPERFDDFDTEESPGQILITLHYDRLVGKVSTDP